LRGGDAIQELMNAMMENRPATVDVEALTLSLGRGHQKGEDLPAQPAAEPAPAPQLPADQAAPPPFVPAAPAPPSGRRVSGRQTVRVRVDRLDRLLNLAGELTVGRQTQAVHLQVLQEVEALVDQQARALLALHDELQRLRFSQSQREALEAHMNAALNYGERTGQLLKHQVERFGQHTAQSKQLIEDLEQEVMAVRLLPVSTLYTNLPRAVRQLAADLGKEVNLVLSGETTELDRKVIESLNDPLTHIVRNALDHGIEPPDERERLGKPREGLLEISARALGSFAQVSIRDDGRGMSPQHLRETAVRKGLLSNEAAALLSDQEAIELIFLPGFSTTAMITDISGRGVGMDVVRTNVSELGGHVQLESTPGAGTRLTMVLPLTLVTTRVLLLEVGEHMFGVPASGCQGTIWVYPDDIRTVEGRAMVIHEGRLAPLLRLDTMLGVKSRISFDHARRLPAFLIGTAQRPIVLMVDRLQDEREVVVKPLGPLLERQRRYGGAIQMGDGRLVLMLNPVVLAHQTRGMAMESPVAAKHAQKRRSRLLVIDDSFATRELIRSILSTAGYEVSTAVDGMDALDKLRLETYDLVVSDVEMPRMDGFTLTSQIRTELRNERLPVIIMTSLATDAHRRRGLEVGAQAYIVKSQFNQGNLLETIHQLLGG
jgi:two-component system chemotaxis sensor kinase CheA